MSCGFKDSSGKYTKIAGKSESGGTTDYSELENKPSINDVELSGNKSAEDLGLYTKEETDGKLAVINKAINDDWQGNGYNLLPFLYKDSSKTVNGITFTVNADGSITANGTATTTVWFNVIEHDDMPNFEIGKTYRLSGCPSGGGTATYFLKSRDAGGSNYDSGNGYIFTHSADITDYLITIRISSGVVCDNVVFKPMLVKVSDDGSYPTEYQRYGYGNITLSGKADDLYKKVNNRKRLDLPLENLIPQDADLNNYTDVGEYCNPYSAVSATLLHCPVSASGFRLTVEKLYSDEPTQTLESYSGIIYKRTYNSSGSAWLDWRKITLDGNPIVIQVNPSTTPTTEGAIWIEIV